MANEETAALRHRFDLLKGAEHHKNALIEVRLRRLYNTDKHTDRTGRSFCDVWTSLLRIIVKQNSIMPGNLTSIEMFR